MGMFQVKPSMFRKIVSYLHEDTISKILTYSEYNTDPSCSTMAPLLPLFYPTLIKDQWALTWESH